MHTIREFNPTQNEYESAVGLVNLVWPDDPNTVENWQHWDRVHDKKYLLQRFVAEENARMIGVSLISESVWSYKPGKYGIEINVHPDLSLADLGNTLYQHLVDFASKREPAPVEFYTYTREDKQAAVEFWQSNGFAVAMREQSAQLDTQGFDPAPFAGSVEKMRAGGIEIMTLPEYQRREPEWRQKLYDLENQIDDDVPTVDPTTPAGLDEFEKRFTHPNFLPNAWFIALDQEEPVGMSTLWLNKAKEEMLGVGITGVLRSHRRRGIATSLKLQTIDFTQRSGKRYIETENEENNPMYDLNTALGFEPKPAWLEMRASL